MTALSAKEKRKPWGIKSPGERRPWGKKTLGQEDPGGRKALGSTHLFYLRVHFIIIPRYVRHAY